MHGAVICFVVATPRLVVVAVNESTVQCEWSYVAGVRCFVIFSCSASLQDGLCHVSMDFAVVVVFAPCGLRGCKNRPAPFPISYKATKPGLICHILACFFYCVVVY